MDAVSYANSAKQAQRIKKFIQNPDSTSGIVTVPKVIASGETITIPAGRVAVLPNVQIDGVLNVEGEVFIPSGATLGDLDAQLALKADTSYVNAAVAPKANTADLKEIGVGQTWQDVTASRVFATTYTNSTGKPIFALISSFSAGNNNQNISITAYVNSMVVSNAGQFITASGGNNILSLSIIIPIGATYKVVLTGPNNSIIWTELR